MSDTLFTVLVVIWSVFLISGFTSIGINIYFIIINKKYLKKMDDYVYGKDKPIVLDDLLFRSFRFVDYTMLITFPWIAQRNHPNAKQLSREAPIPKHIRYLMNVFAICLIVGVFSMIIGYFLMPS